MGALSQLAGFWTNFKAFLIRVKPPDFLPPSLRSLGDFIFNSVAYAFGLKGDAYNQIVSSAALVGVTFLSGFLTGGLAWILMAVFLLTLLWGILRWFPALDSLWRMIRPPLARLYGGVVDLIWRWDA